jgi:hypothetical protein
VRTSQPIRSPRPVKKLLLLRLTRRALRGRQPRLVRSLRLIPRLHLAPKLLRGRRKKIRGKNSLVSSELTAMHRVKRNQSRFPEMTFEGLTAEELRSETCLELY